MRLLNSFPLHPYSADPWKVPLAARWPMLWGGEPRIAYVYEYPDNSTFRYRAYNMVQALGAAMRPVGAAYFFLSELSRPDLLRLAEIADIVVLCRIRYDSKVAVLADAMVRAGKPMLFDVDDLVFAPRHIPVVMQTLGHSAECCQSLDMWFACVGRLRATLDLCSGAVATNDFLAARIREERDIPVAVIPNFMNREQLDISERLVRAKRELPPAHDGKIWLGYFSGTPTHNRDFGLLSHGLAQVMRKNPHIYLALVGYLDLPPALVPLAERVRRYPFQDFVNLQRLIAAVDVNLMPLQINTFTNCKSELKYFEAAIVETPSIASPSHVYSMAVAHKKTGFIATGHKWGTTIYNVLAAPEDLAAIAVNARRDALARYSYEVWGRDIAKRLQAVVCRHSREPDAALDANVPGERKGGGPQRKNDAEMHAGCDKHIFFQAQ